MELPFGALNLEGRVRPMPCLKRAIEQGTVSWRAHDGYRIVQRLRAASMGLPLRERTGFALTVEGPVPTTPLPDAATLAAIRAMDPRNLRDQLVGT